MTKIFIIAGEASGDYLGSRLMEDIKSIINTQFTEINSEFSVCSNVEFIGIGGEHMEKAGLKKIFSIDDLSIIGIWEVIGKIIHVKKMIKKTVEKILSYNPDVIVTIDSSGFTHRIDKMVKKHIKKNGLRNIPIVHYVAPPVWAWRSWRAKSLHKFIDKLLVILPFEPELFQKYNLKTVFVGHPIVSDITFEKPTDSEKQIFLKKIGISTKSKKNDEVPRISISICSDIEESRCCNLEKIPVNRQEKLKTKIITLLPGSRKSEIDAHIPVLSEFCDLMVEEYKNVKFIIPTTNIMRDYIQEKVKNWKCTPIIVDSTSEKNSAYYISDIAIAASGTVVLELARTGLPSIVIYKTSAITSAIVRFLVKVKFVSLINILAGKEVVHELLQRKCTSRNIFEHVKLLMNSEEAELQKNAYKQITSSLTVPQAKLAAIEVLKMIQRSVY